MELVLAILSLIWVIGILSLQRLDSIINDFASALGIYLSLNEKGEIKIQELPLYNSIPKVSYLKHLLLYRDRKDINGLQKSLQFFEKARKIKFAFEVVLITVTLSLPFIELFDFSHLSFLTFLDKNIVFYCIFTFTVLLSFSLEKLLSDFSDKSYPINYNGRN